MAVDERLIQLCSYYRDAEIRGATLLAELEAKEREAFGFSVSDAAAS